MSASSSTFPSQSTFESEDVTMTDNPIQPSVPTVEITSTVPSKGKKIITEEDWKWLKPIVSHLYIDKDLTFVQIQTKLRIEHDFYLSRRTFTKKIDKWGLKKNLRKSERNELLKLGPKNEKFRRDHRLRNEAKLKRLQKRYGGDSTLLGHCNSSRSDNMEIDEDEETTTAIHSQQFPQNDPLNMENLEDQTQSRDDEVEEIIPQSSGIDTSISNQWSEPTIINVDELAVALENLGLRGVRQLLTPYKSPADLKDSDSDMGPQQPLRPFREGGSDTESYSTQDQLRRCRRASADTRNERDRSLTFGPYHEISVFPARPKKFSRMTWDAYVTKVNREWQIEGERLISTLQSPTLCNKERISILDRLLSLENSMLSSNSSTCEELLTVLRGETKCDRRRITKIYFHLIERYINTSQIQRVPNLIREYLNELKSDEKNDFVKLELLFLQAHYLYHLDQSNKAEHLIRRVIWFAFTRFGPYHDFTIHALHLYNMIKERLSKGTFIEAENIYRFNISICSGEVADFNFELWYSNATSLVWYFGLNRRYEEAQSLCTYVMKRAELVFGTDSGVYISCRIEQAHIWRKQGKISESLNLLYLLSGNSNLSERAKYKISNDIGFILMEMKDYSKAEIWYRKTLESSVIMYGLQHPCILVNCENLGYCFEMLGRWSAALRLYRKFLERLRKCRGVDQSSVEKVEGWISRGEREIEMIAQEKESGKNENTDGGANTEGAGDMESEQSQALNDSDGIDWDELHAKSPSAFYVV